MADIHQIKKNMFVALYSDKTATTKELYTIKEFRSTDKLIDDLNTSFYIPEIQKLEFYLPPVRIIGTHQCGNKHREAFKHCGSFQYV